MLPESGTLMPLPKRNWMDMTWQDVAGAGADAARWIAVLPLAAVEQHGPHLPLGVDTYKDDPISQFKLDSPDFLVIGARLAKLGLPTLFVMEGGYAVEAIGVNAANTLQGFLDASPN